VTSFADKAAPVREIEICKRSEKTCLVISLDGVPNGLPLPHLLARVAAQHGIPLRQPSSPRRSLEHGGKPMMNMAADGPAESHL
jgi:hypothetical protein